MSPCSYFSLALLFITSSFTCLAQGGGANAGGLSLPVGRTSSVQTATLAFTAPTVAGSPFTINVLTQGSPGLDFNFVPGGSCSTTASYAVGDTCTVEYTFSPRFPGVRYGGISLTTAATVLANTYLQGTGIGPQAAFAPAQEVTLGGNLYFPSATFAIDGAGNIYTVQFFGAALVEIPSGCKDASCTVVLTDFADFGSGGVNPGIEPEAIAIDGSGNLYIAGLDLYGPVVELPRGCFHVSCAISLGYGISNVPGTVAVDESGKSGGGTVYTTGSYKGGSTTQNNFYVIEIPPGCTQLSCIMPISQPFSNQIDFMRIDAAGNIFFGGTGPASDPLGGGTYEIPAGCKSVSCTIAFTGPGGGEGVSASDSAGNLYVTNFAAYLANPNTWEFPAGCFDLSCVVMAAPNSYQWYLPRVQSFNGNIYRINDGGYAVTEYDLTDPATVTFPATIQGQVSPQQTVTLTNEGNFSLALAPSILQPNPTISQYFQLDSTSAGTCGALSATSTAPMLAANTDCTFPLDFAPVAPALGTITGQSVITDDNLNVAGATQTIPLVGDSVLPGTTFTALTSSLNPSSVGQSVTFTASVTSPSGTPTGSVTFTDGATMIGTATVNASGVVSVTTTMLPAGLQTIIATFNPTGIFLASSGTLQQQVYPDVATDTLLGVVTPIAAGTVENLSVTVMATPVGVTPTGTVTLTDNGVPVASATLVNGTVSFPGVLLPVGTDVLSCAYSGDANYGVSNCTNVTVTVTAAAAATSLMLTPSANPAGAFAPLSLTAVLTSNSAPVSGIQVTFSVDGNSIGTKTTNAQGTIVDNPGGGLQLAPGQHTLTAVSTGNASYASAMATVVETVNLVPTASTLTAAPSASTYGSNVMLSVSIAGTLTGTAATALSNSGLTPGGTVTFYANSVAIGSVAVSGSAAQLTLATLPGGADIITCNYSGDANFAASACPGTSVAVSVPLDFSIAVGPGTQTVHPGDTATYTVTLAGVGGPFTSPVTLSVSGLPAGATATFGQQIVTPGTGPTTTTLSIRTSPSQAMLRGGGAMDPIYCSLVLLPWLIRRRTRRSLCASQTAKSWVASCVLLVALQVLSGCGGGYFGPQPSAGTITVVGTAGSLAHSTHATLIVE